MLKLRFSQPGPIVGDSSSSSSSSNSSSSGGSSSSGSCELC